MMAYLIEMPIVDENALVVWDGYDARASGNQLGGVVAGGFSNSKGQFATAVRRCHSN